MPHGRSPRHTRRRPRAARAKPASEREPTAAPVESEETGGRVRLQKLLARTGVASRRACEALVREGRVSVNGVVAGIGDSADPACDRVELDGERVRLDRPVYWIFHKPVGVLTTRRDPEGRATVFDWLPDVDARLFPVGRLDRDTSGLLLLTNDGDLAHALLHPSLGNEREYEVTVRGTLAERTVERLERGVRIDDAWTAPARVTRQRSEREPERTHFHLTLAEGRKRQIRRALRVLGHPVVQLVRVRLGPLRLGRLPRGEARSLRREEITALRKHVAELRSAPAKRGRRRR